MNNNDDSVNKLFEHILRLTDESDRRINEPTKKVCKYMLSRMNFVISTVKLLNSTTSLSQNALLSDVSLKKLNDIEPHLINLKALWDEKNVSSMNEIQPDFSNFSAERNYTGRRGRPSVIIDISQVKALRDYHFKWDQIAKILCVNRSTIWRKLKDMNYDFDNERYSDISKEQLDLEVQDIKNNHPLAGERMIVGFLRAKGITVQRLKVRESIHAIDPLNCVTRWLEKNPRWIYSVPGPNSLWHNDGLHKLIRWGIVIHGCIDGFSRMVTSLICASNNYAETALSGFMQGVNTYGLPARVRGDRGGENVGILRFMREKQGYEGAYIQGKSVHNQRIERLHYDTTHCVLSHFKAIFYYLEEINELDLSSQIDLFALHFVYLPIIQRSLNEFQEAWNHHQLSTERNQTPYQLWLIGMMDKNKANQRGVRMYLESEFSEEYFGVDPSPPLGILPDDDHSIVEVHNINLADGTDNMKNLLELEFDPLAEDGNYGINCFKSVKNRIKSIV